MELGLAELALHVKKFSDRRGDACRSSGIIREIVGIAIDEMALMDLRSH
jgi:hypothetical protein